MLDSILLFFIIALFGVLISLLMKISTLLQGIWGNSWDIKNKLCYKMRESTAEAQLAEEFDTDEEESLFKTKDGKYSYRAYADNKKRKEALERGEEFIDDFEEAAVKAERKNPYAR